jgi:hypothetical protein
MTEPSSGECSALDDLDVFYVNEDGCTVYSSPPPAQSQETKVIKEKADIQSYLEVAREVADNKGLNEKQSLFLFGCASHLDSVQSEETQPGCPEPGNSRLAPVAEAANEQKQLLLYSGGEGGTGKSVCIHSLVELFQKKEKRHAIIVTATSGTAGFNIRGITVHSALGINTHDSRARFCRVKGEDLVCWQKKEAIVIDECSMMSTQLLV